MADAPRAAWEAVLATLVAERGDALARYAYVLCGDRDEAADLVQSALVATFGRVRNGFEIDRAEAYVRRAIASAHIDRGRKASRWRSTAHLHLAEQSIESPSARVDQRIDLRAELGSLSPRERACVVLRYYGDHKVDDIAADLGISAGAVKRYLSDGLAKLARALTEPAREHHV
ncbi:MAG: sigma-70 family RNA polymerase sigma factor [Microcella sp.]|uniref:sigma-70 family RNA polymerase sigma factor n=1 Tax=Microcella sp. TaxID=1913979 RepID=UPI0024CD480B|nr:sigma-70 family RNA polymerase sigma factor [Microcella sp.]UYN83929.1 MAG: sigma-70 family RNA polymerase sigma factor [Microcella sp.]